MTGAGARTIHLCQGLAVGGLERIVIDLARCARAAGHDDRICCFDQSAIDPLRDFDPADVPVCFEPRRRGLDPSAVRRLARVLGRARPAVLHAHNSTAAVYGAAARAMVPTRIRPALVVTFHNWPVRASPRARWLTAFAARRARSVVAVSRELADRLSAGGWSSPIGVVANGVDVRRFAPRPRTRSRDQLVVGMAARLVPGKRHDLLFAAVGRARAEGAELTVSLAGDGPARERVDPGLNEIGGSRRARVRDMPAWWSDLDIAALLSDHEGAPIAALEALAAGLPLVASAVGGLPELVASHDAAMLVPNDERAIASALLHLGDPGRRHELGARARRCAVERHAIERCAAAYTALYAL